MELERGRDGILEKVTFGLRAGAQVGVRNRNNRQNQDPEEIVRNQFSIGVGRINFRKKRERYSSSKLGNILL